MSVVRRWVASVSVILALVAGAFAFPSVGPVTAPEISEIRGVDCSGVLANLISRKLITTAGRKQVIGRPILYKTTKDFLLRFGLKDVSELPSIEEFEKLTSAAQGDLLVEGSAQTNGAQDASSGEIANQQDGSATEDRLGQGAAGDSWHRG